jgi:FkbM family methyltransferase
VEGSADFSKFETAMGLLRARDAKRFERLELLLDVGGNIGGICLPAVKRGFASRAIAIEPEATNLRLLRANIALNDLRESIEVIDLAAGPRENEMLPFEISNDNWGDHRVTRGRAPGNYGEADRAHIEVRSTTLDAMMATSLFVRGKEEPMSPVSLFARWLRGASRPTLPESTFVWMDIQGYEGHALTGGSNLLAARPPIALEFWPYGMERADSYGALRAAIAHYSGFYDLSNPGDLRPLSDLDPLRVELGPDGHFTDILVV